MKGVIAIITLYLNSNKKLSAVNRSKIYYGENRIGEIKIIAPETIGSKSLSNCELTLYVMFEEYYINYSLDFSGNTCIVPITDDITEAVGDHEMFIEITSANKVLGRTNSVNLKVYPFPSRETEIIKREVYIAQIEELISRVNSYETALDNVKNAIIYWGTDVNEDTPIEDYGDLIKNLDSIPSSVFKGVVDGSISTEVIIPYGAKLIKDYLFYCDYNIKGVTIPLTVTGIGSYAFSNCIEITVINIPHGVRMINSYAFAYDYKLATVSLPNTINNINGYAFHGCNSLEHVTIENGFKGNGLNLSSSTLYSSDTIVSWLNALGDCSNDYTRTFTIGSQNLAKLTSQQIAIATNKNWNLA